MAPRAFDFCHGCFALRQSSKAKNMWLVSKLFDQNLTELVWGAVGEPSIFYHIEQGTWGTPGSSPAIYLFNARTEAADPDMRRCLWQRGDALMWDMCADQTAEDQIAYKELIGILWATRPKTLRAASSCGARAQTGRTAHICERPCLVPVMVALSE